MLGPLLEDPIYRWMRKALIREIAQDTVSDWAEADAAWARERQAEADIEETP